MATVKAAVTASGKAATARFIGFYLSLKDRQAELDHLIWQFYSQLLKGLKLYGMLKVFIDRKELELTESLMELRRQPPPNVHTKDMPVEFILFRGDYIKAFQDGFVIFNILQLALTSRGQSTDGLKAQYEVYKKAGKSNPYLRASYWFLGNNFVMKLPSEFHIAFSVDCLLYGEWRCDHPNLVGLHLLALAWTMGVPQFSRFQHPGLLKCGAIAQPMFSQFLANKGVQLSLSEPPPPSPAPKPTQAPPAPLKATAAATAPVTKPPTAKGGKMK